MIFGEQLAVRVLSPVADYFRPRRMRTFVELMKITPETTILDVGGSELNWRYLPFTPEVTITNIIQQGERSRFPWVFADGRNLPFPDRSFDVVFSNSTIEHVGTRSDQERFACEIRRVGRSYFVQTPYWGFPFDVHMLCPMFHWLPMPVRRLLMPCTPWGLIHRPSRAQIEQVANELRLVGVRDMLEMFPGCRLIRERCAGITKSLIVVPGV